MTLRDRIAQPSRLARFAVGLGCALGLAVLAGCADPSTVRADGDASVLATTPIWADVATQVTCGAIDVGSIVPPGADSHDFELDVRDADRLRSADLLLANGLGLEESLHSAIDSARDSGVKVITLADGLEPLIGSSHDHGDHDHGDHDHDGEDLDPHVWMDPDRVVLAAQSISDALAETDSVVIDTAELEACTADYIAQLRDLAAELDERFGALEGSQRRIVTDHEALGYLADRFDLEVIGTVVPSTSSLGETNPRDLDVLAAAMDEFGVTRVFGRVAAPEALESALSRSIGAPVTVERLDIETVGAPDGPQTYVELMRHTADVISAPLG